MLAWVLHKNDASDYENGRLLEEAAAMGIELRLVRPGDVDLLVARKGRKSVRLNGDETPLPDVFLPRTGRSCSSAASAWVCERVSGMALRQPARCWLARRVADVRKPPTRQLVATVDHDPLRGVRFLIQPKKRLE